MSADEQGRNAANMARAGHERDARRPQQDLEGSHRVDGDGEGRAQDDGGTLAEGHGEDIEKSGESQLEERAEYHEALPDERDEMVLVSS